MSSPEAPKSFLDKAKAAATKAAKNAKLAAQIAAKQAEHGKISKITLPNAYWALGKDIRGSGRFRDEFGDLYAKVDALVIKIKSLKQAQPAPDQPQKFTDRAKAAAGHAADLAKAKAAEMEAHGVLRELGKRAYQKHGDQSGAATVTQPIMQALARMETLEKEIEAISESRSGGFLTPKRLFVGGGVLVALLLLFFIGRMFTGGGAPKGVVQTKGDLSRSGSPNVGSNSKEKQSASGASTSRPVEDIPQTEIEKDFPDEAIIATLPEKVSLGKAALVTRLQFNPSPNDRINAGGGSRWLAFSPGGEFFTATGGHDGKIWNTSTWKELAISGAKNNRLEGDGIFSPDGKSLACFADREHVMLWSLRPDSASLKKTVDLRCSDLVDFVDYHRELGWCKDGTLVTRNLARGFQFLRDDGAGQIAQIGSVAENEGVVKTQKSVEDDREHTLDERAVSPRGDVWAGLPTRECGPDGSHSVFIYSIPSGKLVKKLKVTPYAWQLVFAPNGQSLVAFGMMQIKNRVSAVAEIWNTTSWRVQCTVSSDSIAGPDTDRLYYFWVHGLSPDAKTLAIGIRYTGSWDKSAFGSEPKHWLTIWDAESGAKLQQCEAVKFGADVTYTSHGNYVILGGDCNYYQHPKEPSRERGGLDSKGCDAIEIWDVRNGQRHTLITVPPAEESPTSKRMVDRIAISPNGRFLITHYHESTYLLVWALSNTRQD